jgi:type II secretory pathway component GspD/PulD (secretin)
MKTTTALLLPLLLGALSASYPAQGQNSAKPAPKPRPAAALANLSSGEDASASYTSLDAPTDAQSSFAPGMLKFTDADLNQVLDIYQEISNRTMVRPGNLPNIKITVRNQTRLTRREALQTLDTVLAANGITTIPLGARHIKAVPMAQASSEAAPVVDLPYDELPESGTYITYVTRLKNIEPNEAVPVLQPFAKMPNSILTIPSADMLILRDYSVNVRRMVEVINKVEAGQKNAGAPKP